MVIPRLCVSPHRFGYWFVFGSDQWMTCMYSFVCGQSALLKQSRVTLRVHMYQLYSPRFMEHDPFNVRQPDAAHQHIVSGCRQCRSNLNRFITAIFKAKSDVCQPHYKQTGWGETPADGFGLSKNFSSVPLWWLLFCVSGFNGLFFSLILFPDFSINKSNN